MKAPMRLRRRQFRGAHAKAKVIRQTRTKRAERPVDALSRQGSVWERTVTATVVVMGDGDERIHSTNTDTGRRRMGVGNLSRDRRPSRTSPAGPAAPLQRPCTSNRHVGRMRQHVSTAPCPLRIHVHLKPFVPSHQQRWIHHDYSVRERRPRPVVFSIQSFPHLFEDPTTPQALIYPSPTIGTVLGPRNETNSSSNQTFIATGTAAVCNALDFMLVGPRSAHPNPSHQLGNNQQQHYDFRAHQQDKMSM